MKFKVFIKFIKSNKVKCLLTVILLSMLIGAYNIRKPINKDIYINFSQSIQHHNDTIIVLIIILLVSSLADSDEINWGSYYKYWSDVAIKEVNCIYENNYYHYIFNGRLLHKSEHQLNDPYPNWTIYNKLSAYYDVPNLYPIWNSIESKRNRKINSIIN